MRIFAIFLFKELKEQLKNFKAIILFAVLLVFGMTSPLLAKLTPELIKTLDIGFEIKMPTPTFLDSYVQYFKNLSQLGVVVIIIIFSGGVIQEKTKGTALLVLSRGLSKTTFILSKLFANIIYWSISFSVSAFVCYFYAIYLFPNSNAKNIFLSMLCFWLFVVLILCFSSFTSLFGKSIYISLLSTFAFWGFLMFTSISKKLEKYSPIVLGAYNTQIIAGSKGLDELFLPIVVTVLLIIAFVSGTILVFSKQEI